MNVSQHRLHTKLLDHFEYLKDEAEGFSMTADNVLRIAHLLLLLIKDEERNERMGDEVDIAHTFGGHEVPEKEFHRRLQAYFASLRVEGKEHDLAVRIARELQSMVDIEQASRGREDYLIRIGHTTGPFGFGFTVVKPS